MNPTPFFPFVRPLAVVAFGGNALLPPEDDGSTGQQLERAREAVRKLIPILGKGYELIVVHGNGPQVGNILMQAEEAAEKVPPQTLDFCVAQTEGSIGFLLELAFDNELPRAGFRKQVVTIMTQVEVDAADPAFLKPTKPVGPFFSKEKAELLKKTVGWTMVEDAGRGWRKVVASPRPREVRGVEVAAALINRGHIVIAAGGGGIPVVADEHGNLSGVAAVIDKDLASAVLAGAISADVLVISTAVEKVCLNHGQPNEQALDSMTAAEARRYVAEGHFHAGSMLPKVQACLQFLAAGGREALITSSAALPTALAGKTGTRVVP